VGRTIGSRKVSSEKKLLRRRRRLWWQQQQWWYNKNSHKDVELKNTNILFHVNAFF
jgi:hypothetical protein